MARSSSSIWGPGGGGMPESWGAKAATDGILKFYNWMFETSKGADLAIHECFLPNEDFVSRYKFQPAEAIYVSTLVHTTAPVFGKIMALTEPKHAVAYHFQNDPDTLPDAVTAVRKGYEWETLPLMDEIHEEFNEEFGTDSQFPLRPAKNRFRDSNSRPIFVPASPTAAHRIVFDSRLRTGLEASASSLVVQVQVDRSCPLTDRRCVVANPKGVL